MRARLLKGAYGFVEASFDTTTVRSSRLWRLSSLTSRLGACIDRPGTGRAVFHLQRLSIRGSLTGRALAWKVVPVFRPVADVRRRCTSASIDRCHRTLSVCMDVRESAVRPNGPPLEWEHSDNSTWRGVERTDETGTSCAGMVERAVAGVKPLPVATVTQASGLASSCTALARRRHSQRSPSVYRHCWWRGGVDDGRERFAEVPTLMSPLGRAYSSATIGIASLPRFGKPRAWIRARLSHDGDPRGARSMAYPNAVWAEQLQSFENEVIGSRRPRAESGVFRAPQTGRARGRASSKCAELEGARAAVRLPMLREDLLRQG